jgi:hypothetical protein
MCKQIGRQAHMRGDGTLELTNAGASSIPKPHITSEDSISNFSIQNFPEIEAVSWDRSSTLTKLITIATVCNKAKFVFTDDNSGELGINLAPAAQRSLVSREGLFILWSRLIIPLGIA